MFHLIAFHAHVHAMAYASKSGAILGGHQVIGLGGKPLYLQSRLASPNSY